MDMMEEKTGMRTGLSKDEERLTFLAFCTGALLLAVFFLPLLHIDGRFSFTYWDIVEATKRVTGMGNIFTFGTPMAAASIKKELTAGTFVALGVGALAILSAVGLILGAHAYRKGRLRGEPIMKPGTFFPVFFWVAPLLSGAGLLRLGSLRIPDGFLWDFLREGFPFNYPGIVALLLATGLSLLGILGGGVLQRSSEE